MNKNESSPLPIRKRPAREQLVNPRFTELIFITCCTRRKIRVLDNELAHNVLVSLWNDKSHWTVAHYVIMPDHIHLIVYASQRCSINLRSWVAWWKSIAARKLEYKEGMLWLADLWDTRIRNCDHLAEKLTYMKENPMRAGLITDAESWPFSSFTHHKQTQP